ncbi:MAG: large subunit ribosomal protein L28 [Planctomycetota bacterium]|jgi:large subunit ribosomal protein L28
MSRVCKVTGRGTRAGGTIARRGLPKKNGGIGLNITGRSKRKFKVNVQPKRIWVPELGEFMKIRISTRALKDIDRKGAYKVLLDAGLISPARARQGKITTAEA